MLLQHITKDRFLFTFFGTLTLHIVAAPSPRIYHKNPSDKIAVSLLNQNKTKLPNPFMPWYDILQTIILQGLNTKMDRQMIKLKRIKCLLCRMLYLTFVLIFCANLSNCFNIDTKHAQIHRRPNTGFGYSVDFLYRDQKRDKFRSVWTMLK